jgi:GAF domain-containing protein
VRPDRDVGPDVRRWAARLVDPALLFDDEPQPVLPDASLDRYARLVQSALGVPMSLVTIVESDRQVFPGAVGLPPDLAVTRETPLSFSFCKHVVASGTALIVPDARLDSLVSDNASINAYGVVSYVGYPVTDSSGAVIGTLCALDTVRRDWAAPELTALEDLAAACSTEIALRESRRAAAAAARAATDASQRARMLVSLTDRLSRARTLTEISRALLRVAVEDFDCVHTAIWAVDADDPAALRYVADPDISWPEAGDFARVRLDESAAFWSRFPVLEEGAVQRTRALVVQGETVGWLLMQWADKRIFTAEDDRAIDAIATATAWAVLAVRTS